MNTINKILTVPALMFSMAYALTSCGGFLEEQSQDLAKVESWQDLDEVLLGDGYMHSGKLESSTTSVSKDGDSGLDILHFMTDEIIMNNDDQSDYCHYVFTMFPFYTWQQDTGTDYKLKYSGGDEKYWDDFYRRINVCNMVIYMCDEIGTPDVGDAEQVERVKGEAYFLRGLYYFYLANFYAKPYEPTNAATTPGVPIKLTELVEDIEFTRASLSDTYSQIIDDLKQAETLLEGKTAKSLYHANVTAARLLLARVYLYMQDWSNAVAYASKVLDDNNSLLNIRSVDEGGNYVSISSPETIFSMGHYLIAGEFTDNAWGDYDSFLSVSPEMMSMYGEGDLRTTRYVGPTHTGIHDDAFLKYNLQYPNFGNYCEVSSYCLFRTPEAYLILAEASAYNNDESAARNALETFLTTRMDATPSIAMTGKELIDFIRDERAREFLLEGHRWFDLRRYTVCVPYKWSKEIVHAYKYYGSTSYKELDYIDTYRLQEYDDAYTLPIPRKVAQFQVSLGNNTRPARTADRQTF